MSERFATKDELWAGLRKLPQPPVALEALWDGDSGGWFVVLAAVVASEEPGEPPFRHRDLGAFRGPGGDMRVLNGQVPPWPEARHVAEVGGEIAEQLGVPFYFPSPDHPEEDCPAWWEQERGQPCADCGILLLQEEACVWRGWCYHCHLDRTRVRHVLQPGEVPCHICGRGGFVTRDGDRLCAPCRERYVDYYCPTCGLRHLWLGSVARPKACHDCTVREKLQALPPEERDRIRGIIAASGAITAIKELRTVWGFSIPEAADLVDQWRPEE